jgi:predicted component of type VI protein secretion system
MGQTMALRFTIENPEILGPGTSKAFSSNGGSFTIGGPDADWRLGNPNGSLSNTPCLVEYRNGAFLLRALSRGAVTLNDAPVEKESLCELRDGDLVAIGAYRIRAHLDEPAPLWPGPEGRALASSEIMTSAFGAEKTRLLPTQPSGSTMQPPLAGPAPSSVMRAFAQGAGIDPHQIDRKSDEEFAELLGGLFAIILPGLMKLLASKKDMRSLIGLVSPPPQAHNNNPLAALSDSEEAMRALFAPPRARYLAAATSFEETFDTLERHDEAFFKAMQVALFRLLNRLAPESIEQSVRRPLLGSSDAMAWKRFVALWDQLNETGENGLLDLFLHYMQEAYEEEYR